MNNECISPSEAVIDDVALPGVSVIMITRGRHQLAEKAVSFVLACSYPREKIQLVIVEETAVPQVIAGSDIYHPIPVNNLGFGHARNVGLSLADRQIIAFVDDDCVVEEGWLRELVSPLITGGNTAAVAGAVLLPAGSGLVGQCESILGFPGGGMKYVHEARGNVVACESFSTCNCAARRSAIDEAGAFLENLKYGGEDESLSRLIARKYRLVFNPRAIVRHAPRGTVAGIFGWFLRRGKASGAMIWNDISWRKSIMAGLTSQTVRLLSALVIVLLLDLPVLPVCVILAFMYYISVLSRVWWSARYYSLTTVFLVPLVKLVMDFGMDAGIAASIFGGKDRD